MTDFLVTFLASMLHEQGVSNAVQVAERAAHDLRREHVIDERGVKKAAIRADPCRDYKLVARHHHVTISMVYRAWRKL